LGVGSRVSSAKARAGTISVVKVSAKVRITVGVKAGIAVTREIKRTGLIVRVFRGFKAKAGYVITADASTRNKKEV
jgi:hypothetical protein